MSAIRCNLLAPGRVSAARGGGGCESRSPLKLPGSPTVGHSLPRLNEDHQVPHLHKNHAPFPHIINSATTTALHPNKMVPQASAGQRFCGSRIQTAESKPQILKLPSHRRTRRCPIGEGVITACPIPHDIKRDCVSARCFAKPTTPLGAECDIVHPSVTSCSQCF